MRSLTIVVAMLSMAAGAWQGTTAQSEQPRSATAAQGTTDTTRLTLRGCVQRGLAAGTYLLVTPGPAVSEPGLDPASSPLLTPEDAARPPDGSTPAAPSAAASPSEAATSQVTYEIVAGTPDVDLAAIAGRRVELHGTPERTARGATADESPTAEAATADRPAGSPTTVGTTGTSSSGSAAPSQRSRVRVTALTSVGGPCP